MCSHNTPVGVDVLGDPKTNGYLYENGGRGNLSPTTKKPKPRGAADCSRDLYKNNAETVTGSRVFQWIGAYFLHYFLAFVI